MAPVPAPAPATAGAPSGLAVLVPYKNVCALIGYYLAVFSLIPCVGVLLGIPAVILGILGVRRAKVHPDARGKVHAWFAIIFASVCVAANVVVIANLKAILGR